MEENEFEFENDEINEAYLEYLHYGIDKINDCMKMVGLDYMWHTVSVDEEPDSIPTDVCVCVIRGGKVVGWLPVHKFEGMKDGDIMMLCRFDGAGYKE